MTRPFIVLAWYRHFNEKYRGEGSFMRVSDCRLTQGTVQIPM